MPNDFIEVKSTDNTTVYLRKTSINGFEVVPSTNRAEGHVKIFIGGYKFLLAIEKDELVALLNE